MSIKIIIEENSILVKDNEVKYIIGLREPHHLIYGMGNMYIPFINNIFSQDDPTQARVGVIENLDYCANRHIHDIVMKYHDEIKKYLFKMDEIHDNLPNLVLCSSPGEEYGKKFMLNNGDCIECFLNRIRYKFIDEKFNFCIDLEEDNNYIYFYEFNRDNEYGHWFTFTNKVVFTNEPFDAEMFGKAIREYIDQYLICLIDLFKFNGTKSARIN